jgi:hypothetical protein
MASALYGFSILFLIMAIITCIFAVVCTCSGELGPSVCCWTLTIFLTFFGCLIQWNVEDRIDQGVKIDVMEPTKTVDDKRNLVFKDIRWSDEALEKVAKNPDCDSVFFRREYIFNRLVDVGQKVIHDSDVWCPDTRTYGQPKRDTIIMHDTVWIEKTILNPKGDVRTYTPMEKLYGGW